MQAPTKYELVINLKTAKALGLDMPATRARPRRRGDRMKRREFITLLGGAAAAWPLAARAQQPAMPVIGFLSAASAEGSARALAAFRKGLSEAGYVEGRNVAIEYPLGGRTIRPLAGVCGRTGSAAGGRDRRDRHSRGACGQGGDRDDSDRLHVGGDPVNSARRQPEPAGRQCHRRVSYSNTELAPKRLELLRELVPTATTIGLLVNPSNPITELVSTRPAGGGAHLGLKLHVLQCRQRARHRRGLRDLAPTRVDALVHRHRSHSSTAARPARCTWRPPRESRRSTIARIRRGRRPDELRRQHCRTYRLAGVYAGRILKGEKPADLPVSSRPKFELVINLKTAKALGLDVPPTLLARADEVIE